MKKLLSILSLGLFVFTGCKEEGNLNVKFSDASFRVGIGQFEPALHTTIGTHMTFLDLSINPESHVWEIIAAGDTNFFLRPDFKFTDTDYESFRMPGPTTTDAKANIVFMKPGMNKVRFYNTFKDSVAYKHKDGITLYPILNDRGLWEIDTVFEVDVYDHIRPAFKVYQGDVETGKLLVTVGKDDSTYIEDEASWRTVKIEKGEYLTYVDETPTGRPNQRQWRIATGNANPEISDKDTATVFYSKEGTYRAGLLINRRIDPLPEASASKLIPLNVKVEPCTTPGVFVDGSLNVGLDDNVSFLVSVPILPFNSKDEVGNFSIHITNPAFDYDETYSPATVALDPGRNTRLILTLPAGKSIHENDMATVTYAGGKISTDCGTLLTSFGPEAAVIPVNDKNLIASDVWNTSFETPKPDVLQPDSYFVQHRSSQSPGGWERAARSAENVAAGTKGDYLLKHSQTGTSRNIARIQHNHDSEDTKADVTETITLFEGEQILVGAWIYVSSGSDDNMIDKGGNLVFALRKGGRREPGQPEVPLWAQFNIDDLVKGKRDEWVKVERIVEISAETSSFNQFRIQYHGGGESGTALFYLDDIEVRRVDRRTE